MPADVVSRTSVTSSFQQHYNYERPNQAITCGNQPPRLAFPALPLRPALPHTIDPDRWIEVLDGHRYVRKVNANGSVSVDQASYYIDQTRAGNM
jgi:hypothetical protein